MKLTNVGVLDLDEFREIILLFFNATEFISCINRS